MNTTYQIIQYSKDHIPEILSSGRCKEDAEYGLIYENLDPRQVTWQSPIERFDPQGGGFQLIYIGTYNG